jgi:hypothetical protein
MKKLCQQFLFFLWAFSWLSSAKAQFSLGQTIQIYTHFQTVIGKPTWLLIIRDVSNGQVLPYVFDIRNNDNFWLALTLGHSYRVTVSNLKWGERTVINNFCHLENGVLSGKSMFLTLTGKLTPNPGSSSCHILKYNGLPFTIVEPNT